MTFLKIPHFHALRCPADMTSALKKHETTDDTDYHNELTMKKIYAFFASLREIIEFFQWTH